MEEKLNIKGLTFEELSGKIKEKGYPNFRAKQIFDWIYLKNISSFQEMTNLPKGMLTWLDTVFNIGKIECIKMQKSSDCSEKYLFKLKDGHFIESVLIKTSRRNTICLSSQVGCLWNCLFCASGKGGFKRNLLCEEIIEQILFVQRAKKEKINNIVYMGMGEPFDNYDNVMKSIKIINSKYGINIGARKITISTCGIIPGIIKLKKLPLQIELSVSLHAADEKTRSMLMPVNNKYPLKKLINICMEYAKEKNRQITFEYLMLKNINDNAEQAIKLSKLISGFNAKVNLIIYNPISSNTDNQSSLLPSDEKTISIFRKILRNNSIPTTVRYSKGQDINAACGQLKNNYINKENDL